MVFVRNYLVPTLVKLGPPKFRRFLVNLLPFENARRLRGIVDVFHNTSIEILEAKRRAMESDGTVEEQIGRGKDIMSILSMYISAQHPSTLLIRTVKANMEAPEEDKLPDSEVLAQVASCPWVMLILLIHSQLILTDDVCTMLIYRLEFPCNVHILTPGL